MLLVLETNMLTQKLDLEQIQKGAFPDSNFGGTTKIGDIISSVLPYIFGAAGIALLIYLILGGFQIMTSRGDPKAKITNAVIGFIIVFLAFIIVQLLGQVLGLKGTLFSQIFGGN